MPLKPKKPFSCLLTKKNHPTGENCTCRGYFLKFGDTTWKYINRRVSRVCWPTEKPMEEACWMPTKQTIYLAMKCKRSLNEDAFNLTINTCHAPWNIIHAYINI